MVEIAAAKIAAMIMPFNPSGTRLEIYGRKGTMVISAPGSLNIGPSVLYAARGKDPLAEMQTTDKYLFVPKDTPPGSPYNVAQAYARAADALTSWTDFDVDFDLAVTRHKLIDTIERSSGWK